MRLLRMMDRAPWPALLLALAVAGCTGSPAPEPFPQEVADAWTQRFVAGDAAGAAELYTEDAQLLPPQMETVNGRAEIQEFIARFGPGEGMRFEMATLETHLFGDYAWRQGRYTAETADGQLLMTGKFAELWKKVDGRWLIHRSIWNADHPPPAEPGDVAADQPA